MILEILKNKDLNFINNSDEEKLNNIINKNDINKNNIKNEKNIEIYDIIYKEILRNKINNNKY